VSDGLLTIDVSSELATLCEAQLRGTWQVPAELVRLALRIGAPEVSVRMRRRSVEILWDGPTVAYDVFADIQTALDIRLTSDDRQRAIAALEEAGMEGLLWAAGLQGSRLKVSCSNSGRCWSFDNHSRKRQPEKSNDALAQTSVAIRWSCRGFDHRRSTRWLTIATRFAPGRILIDGRVLPTGFAGGLYHLQLEEPVPCRLGLTRAGDEPVLWLLRDGVVSARATIPGYPPFEAAVELGGLVSPGASAADMRRAVSPFLEALVDRAVWMMVQVSDRLPTMASGDRERLGVLLLRAANKGIRTAEIVRLSLLEMASTDGSRLSVERVRQLADQRGGVLAAIEASERSTDNLVDPQSTLLASSEVRHLLAELTAVRFQAPSLRRRSFRQVVTDRFRAATGKLLRHFRGMYPRREVPPDDLRPAEAEVLDALRSALTPKGLRICEGRGGLGSARGEVIVPRSHAALKVGTDLVSADAAWLYPLLLALDTGQEPPRELRRRWLRTIGPSALKNDPDHAAP
jgi:hypothetical protein